MVKTWTARPPLIQYPNNIKYLDGSETALFDILSEPSFDEFTAWRNKSDWAQYYHLSPLRKNILSWINFGDRPLRILELGAGCGAITSFLVKIPNSEIVAVEGSLERAQIIQARCKDVKKLSIHNCSIDSYLPDAPFDIITLIGVLEYAGKYEQAKKPFTSVLKRVAGWLSDQGSLLVAIENQLGVKYLSGCAEDHYGVKYEGINNYPHYNGIKTFTKPVLSEMLSSSGLSAQSWFYPYPDYKLPSVIFSDLAFESTSFDYAALLDVPPEPNENPIPTFDNQCFLSLIGQVSSVGNFMNSFLVIASKNSDATLQTNTNDTVAVKTNVKFRARHFQTSTVFSTRSNGIVVTKKLLYPTCHIPVNDIKISIPGLAEPYFKNTTNIFNAIVNSVLENRYEYSLQLINTWIAILNKASIVSGKEQIDHFTSFSIKHFNKAIYNNSLKGLWIPGSLVDLTPLNVLIPSSDELQDSDQCKVIDLEWQLPCEIPLQLIFDRGMNLLTDKLLRIIKMHNISIHQQSKLPAQLYTLLKDHPIYQSMDNNSFKLFESWFQHTIMGTITTPPLDHFLETIVSLVESSKNSEALSYYDKYRKFFCGVPELKQFDTIMGSIREKISALQG